jgi:hypothetical protein
MRRLLTALVFTLPLCLTACASYAVHLYSDPRLLQVVDERIALSEAEGGSDPFAVLMRGDSVVVIGERRNNWEYEMDMHDRYFIVYFDNRRAYVPYRSLVSREQYGSMFGQPTQPAAEPAAPATPPSAGPGRTPIARDSAAQTAPTGSDLTGGPPRAATGRNARR